jgi:thiosulfate dehydrogenase (quinone) large subunit
VNHELSHRTIAYALLRVFLGVNIALHGISRLLDPSKFLAATEAQFAHSPIPHSAVAAFAVVLPWLEALFGLLIIAGLRTGFALIGGASVMLVITVGTCLNQEWQIASVQLIYQITYFILLFLHDYDHWSADTVLRRFFRPGGKPARAGIGAEDAGGGSLAKRAAKTGLRFSGRPGVLVT